MADPGAGPLRRSDTAATQDAGRRPLVADGFNIMDLGADVDAPPAYGEFHDRLQLSQSGFEAGAAVTDDGRVNININERGRKFSDLLAPTLRSQVLQAADSAPEVLPPAYIPPSLGGLPGQTPPPRLNVVIQIVGSRGDVQPFVALGKVLRDTYGHRVRVATHATFQKFVEENGLEFFSIGGDPAELMAFMVKNPGLMPGLDALKSGEIKKRRQGIEEIVLGCWRSCIEAGDGLGPPPQSHAPSEPVDESFRLPGNPDDKPFVADAIIANPPSFAHIHIAEKLGIPLHMMFTMPWSPTRAFPHPLANIQSSNTDVVMANYVSYTLVEMMTWQGLGDVINRFRTGVLDLDPLSVIWAPGLLTRLRIPMTYCWSPALIPKPNDWGNEIDIAGFYFLDLATSYTPDPELAAFLEAGPPPVYIGFGSIVVDDPNKLTKMIFDAITTAGVRALVSKGWGGIGADSVGIPDGVFMLGNCPHDWLFQRVSCVVHHGGAGTTAAGISTGKPTVIVPFFGDQPFWGSMIAKAGAGPKPIPYKDLTAENLAAAIDEALKPDTQLKAQELGQKIREEKGADRGAKSFHDHLAVDKIRCSVAPSRVAVWRVRRTQVRLSTFAAAVLVKEGILKYTDLKLYRPCEYNTDEQPWDPISAMTSALVGDLSSIALAVGDFPREIFKSRPKRSGSGAITPAGEGAPPVTASSASNSTTDVGSIRSPEPERPQSPHELPVELPGDFPVDQSTAQTPDTASLASTHPSFVISTPGPSTASTVQEDASTEITSPHRTLSPTGELKSPPQTPGRSRSSSSAHREASPHPFNLDTAIAAGRGVSRIVGTGVKTPMNFCLGAARGFRNAPLLYHDDMVRPPEKVTGVASGLKVAGKEFGLGIYDGISGLVTQPWRGAEKEGAVGFAKGIGKGIGGLVFKNASALWSIPAYAMQGIHAEIRNLFAKSVQNYIFTSRVLQGEEDYSTASVQEREDIVLRWNAKKGELKGYYNLKSKEKKGDRSGSGEREQSDEPPKTGWFHTRHLSLEDRRKLHAQKEEWKRRRAGAGVGSTPSVDRVWEDDELERAIRESVVQTSRGNTEEDARIEAQIRASVVEMRRAAEQSRELQDFKRPIPEKGILAAPDDITDEEYQALVEEAIRQSMVHQPVGPPPALPPREVPGQDDDEDLQRAIEESRLQASRHQEDDDEELRRAMEESERAHKEQEARNVTARTEEEIIMDYVKRQSLAEEEYRRQKAKGKAVQSGGDDDDDDDEVDEDLKRALEESLKMSGHEDAGPSSSSAA